MNYNLTSSKTKRTVSLVLGSGGARGLAHIGVIRWLEENGYEIDSIAGCSMGALIGGIYAAGKLDAYESFIRETTKMDILTLLDLSWGRGGLIKGDKIIQKLIDLVGDVDIEDLPLTYTAVAADVRKGKEIWINSGRLFDAIRASISLPLFFTPFMYKGIALIDGGVLNPVPIAPTFSDTTDITVAVNLCGRIETKKFVHHSVSSEPVPSDKDAEEKDQSTLTEKVKNFISTHKIGRSKKETGGAPEMDLGAYDIANQAFDAMQSSIARQKLASYPPDYVIEIARNVCGTLEFDRGAEMIDLGYQKAEEILGSARRKILENAQEPL